MKRCSTCKGNNLNHCKGSDKYCECKCVKYYDNVKARVEENRLSNPANDEYVKDILERFRNIES